MPGLLPTRFDYLELAKEARCLDRSRCTQTLRLAVLGDCATQHLAAILPVLFSKSSPSLIELQNPLMSNLGFLFDPKTQLLPYTLASSIDIFNIWSVILLIIGFAAVGRTSRGKSAAIVITWWVIVNLVSLIGPAMQAMRAH